ncbi:haloacid dehalogenase-like hydrolase [Evansella sp. LMS18]|uniref:DUF7916 family protein n=1 Tax=Evansella sp. LMS18 TaxID=2924033 RepID=UPI0020D08BA1|nr:haloacid dehalogenase-like hydrolase [Evansella sp. LMS18]UTR11770.1 haloacid dehalogenase-like hydrolase [Evansella sp. LMS18]
MKRLLSSVSSELLAMTGPELKQAVKASEGRTVIAEVIGAVPSLYPEVTNGEIAAAFGADLILLNGCDVFNPEIQGLSAEKDNLLAEFRRMTGRPLGINLEPVDPEADFSETVQSLPLGRTAAAETLEKVKEEGLNFICLTGNPQTGVSNSEIAKAIRRARDILGEDALIIAGKMHGAGVNEEVVSEQLVEEFVEAGVDVVLLPSPGTVPGVTMEKAVRWAEIAKKHGALTMFTIGTSQEGADESTIRQIALQNKMAGADIHHIGDAGFHGVAVPENIMAYSVAVRGRRHTIIRMARSIRR